jgi:hypothetical protein
MDGDGTVSSVVVAHVGWLRLDHQRLALPLPAVYLPAADLYHRDLTELGFVSAVGVVSRGCPLPDSHHLIADVADPDRLCLMVSRLALFRPLGPPVVVSEDQDTKLVVGSYAVPAQRAWQRSAQKAHCMLLIAGPRPAVGGSAVASPGALIPAQRTALGLLLSPAAVIARVAVPSSLINCLAEPVDMPRLGPRPGT